MYGLSSETKSTLDHQNKDYGFGNGEWVRNGQMHMHWITQINKKKDLRYASNRVETFAHDF